MGYSIAVAQEASFPGFYMPIYVKDRKLIEALQESMRRQTPYAGAFLLKDDDASADSSSSTSETENVLEKFKGKELLNRMHEVGTLAQISSIQGEQVILIGRRRLRITEMVSEDPLSVKVEHIKNKPYDKDDDVIKATYFEVMSTLRDVLKTTSLWRDQVRTYTQHIGDFNYQHLADFGAGISGANKHENQGVLEELDASIAKTVEDKFSGERRQIVLKEQLKAIKKELGVETDSKSTFSEKFKGRIELNKDKIPKHVLKAIEENLTKLQLLEITSSEFDVTLNYLDWLTVLPWGNLSDENFDVLRAEKILDEDHYGKIICLSGPPGVGKTSIGRSIARALDRKFFRFSVGGLSDVAEINGHRRTYIGAMPGKLVQCLKTVGTENPIILIDEIDKLGKGHSGDPASALLEVMDPEQNANFRDHYLDVTIDLSKVFTNTKSYSFHMQYCIISFICMHSKCGRYDSKPLLDRMEVIRLSGYITDEKLHIARDFLVKNTCRDCGIKPEQVDVSDAALLSLIENYCREAGVRNLHKHIEKIYRKIALKLVRQRASTEDTKPLAKTDSESSETSAEGSTVLTDDSATKESTDSKTETVEKVMIEETNLADYVGKPGFHTDKIYEKTPVGVVMGLAWTGMGGSTLYIETTFVEEVERKGRLRITGQLGSVMKESAQIAHTVARRIMLDKEPGNLFFANSKLHLHVPEGAMPKDGPSAGCTMITSLLSLAMKKPVREDLAMTGEVTLTGRILPIGGVKEKTIAARRSQVKMIIFPEANRKDFDELPENVKEGLDVHFVDEYEQVIEEELAKLRMLESDLEDFGSTYGYLDWLTVLPWGKFSDENFDVGQAEKILDNGHYGLSHVKERVLEFIAVRRLGGTSKGKVICLSGPPGVGKTSIGRAIARALGRKFFRFSVGGLSDVDEIKGLRRSYDNALPGKMVNCLKSVGTLNPLVMIDEIDKLGKRQSDDPANALLEILDPEQNAYFRDHYLDVTIDLSKVLFVCTANVVDMIPEPLLDRMEVINISGYITDDKMHIARDHLLKTTCMECGIKPEQVVVSDAALRSLIENYCREPGVRNLQKHIEKIYRRIALKLVREGASAETPEVSVKKFMIDESNLADYVGKPELYADKIYEQTPVGVVMGLSTKSAGGSTLYIETTSVEEGEGKGGLHITGQLGDVMKESAEIAHTVAGRIMLEKEPKNLFFANSSFIYMFLKEPRQKTVQAQAAQ
ncbi:hypothetical protein Bca52824_085319 [Brassica carinata]|uniref:Lon protease homolog n=1 Tax=Brassica carinata TaxID=52824 RepID=A0A8X7TMP2_BRACI|nr:hypothetical protein Bca52824_085319 [Brassica carinata]